MLTIDGSQYSGSGTIVRQAVLYAALTREVVRVVRVRARRPRPGLRAQHLRAIEALRDLSGGALEGAVLGSVEFTFWPGRTAPTGTSFHWDIGSAGSSTVLAQALLPLLLFREEPTVVEVGGGVFQDRAPSAFHMQHVLLPLLSRMGVSAALELKRPGYLPRGGGLVRLAAAPMRAPLRRLRLDAGGQVQSIRAIALSSHLAAQRVSERMSEAACVSLNSAGQPCDVRLELDERAPQAGAALSLIAELNTGARLGVDRAGARGRSSEAVGRWAARRLLEELASGAAVDRFAADQIIPFAALAQGETRVTIPMATEHVVTNAWLAETMLGTGTAIEGNVLRVRGCGYWPGWATGNVPR
jgi:RNA 3'-terminal phosphate cyclase (ATP)